MEANNMWQVVENEVRIYHRPVVLIAGVVTSLLGGSISLINLSNFLSSKLTDTIVEHDKHLAKMINQIIFIMGELTNPTSLIYQLWNNTHPREAIVALRNIDMDYSTKGTFIMMLREKLWETM